MTKGVMPRGRCPRCLREVALARDGSVTRRHQRTTTDGRELCPGSGHAPASRGSTDAAVEPWLPPRELREALGLTQVELAVFLNVGERSVQRCEQARTSPSGSTFVVWEGLQSLAAKPRPLLVGEDSMPLRRWLARGPLTRPLRRRLWAEVLAE
jgi:hypothetical protein